MPPPTLCLGAVLRSRTPLRTSVLCRAVCARDVAGEAARTSSLAAEKAVVLSASGSSSNVIGTELSAIVVNVSHRLEDLRSSSVRVMFCAAHYRGEVGAGAHWASKGCAQALGLSQRSTSKVPQASLSQE